MSFIKVCVYRQGVPGIKINTLGFNSRVDAESKTSYTRGSNSQGSGVMSFWSTVNKLERKEEHCAFIETFC
jgi:hypothetical protein